MKTRTIVMAVLALADLTACVESGTPTATEPDPAPVGPADCAHIQTLLSPATPLVGAIRGPLLATEGPYSLEGQVEVTQLEIEAGTLICGLAGATLHVIDTLIVSGTAEQPVVFTAVDSTAPWGGVIGRTRRSTGNSLAGGAQVTMSDAIVQHATSGVSSAFIDLTSVHVRQIEGGGIAGSGSVKNVVVDTVCTKSGSNCPGILAIGGYRGGTLFLSVDETAIRGSGGHGLWVGNNAVATVSNLVIEDPGGSGVVLAVSRIPFGFGDIAVTGPISIERQGGYLVEGDQGGVAAFMGTYGERAQPGDSVSGAGGTDRPIVVPPGVKWTVEDAPNISRPDLSSVLIGAGAEFSVSAQYGVGVGGLKAHGTLDDPVRITGSSLVSGTLILEHARIELVGGLFGYTGEQRMTDVLIEGGSVRLSAPRARVERVIVENAALAIHGLGSVLEDVIVIGSPTHGIEVAADSVQIRRCVVATSRSDGIHVVEGAGVVVSSCDLTGNGGAGVANEGMETVMARGNWWGDPSGPLGAEGDGVQGAVDHSEPRSVPGASAPVSVVVRPAISTVPTGDSVRFFVEGRDESGLRVSPTLFTLSSLNAALVFPDPDDPFLAVGRSVGTGQVEVVSLADSTLRSSTEISVVEGAPFLRWEWADTTWRDGTAAVLPFTSTRFMVASRSGDIRFVDGTTVTTTRFSDGEDAQSIKMDGPSLEEAWAVWGYFDHSHITHWDGTSLVETDLVQGSLRDTWAPDPSRVFVFWSGGIRELRDGTWTDERTSPDGCRDLAVVSPTEAYVLCSPNVLRYTGSSWEPFPTPPLPSDFRVTSMIRDADGRIRLLGASGGSAFQGLVLEGNAWRTFSVADGLRGVRDYVPFGPGVFVGTNDGLWYLGPTDRWQRVWVGPGMPGQPGTTNLIVQDLGAADGIVFMPVWNGLLRGTPSQ